MKQNGITTLTFSESPHLGGNALEGDPLSYAPSVWDYVIKRFALQSVLDLGGGIGHAAAYFHKTGLKVVAVDGAPENCSKSVFPTLCVDLTKQSVITSVDLVHCQEVVEHIEERYLPNLISSLKAGKYILMTHALPGQGGYHHVNEQPVEYWIEKLTKAGCELLLEDTNRIRRLAQNDGARWFQTSGLLFANLDKIIEDLHPDSVSLLQAKLCGELETVQPIG